MNKTIVAANHFTPEEKLLSEHYVGLCSRPQALSPTITERLYGGAGRFPGCLRHSSCPSGPESGCGSRACGLSRCVALRAGRRFPGIFAERSWEAAAPGACSFCLILAVKHCSAASSFPRPSELSAHILSSVQPPSSGNADGG